MQIILPQTQFADEGMEIKNTDSRRRRLTGLFLWAVTPLRIMQIILPQTQFADEGMEIKNTDSRRRRLTGLSLC
jgi:hypothetical protein